MKNSFFLQKLCLLACLLCWLPNTAGAVLIKEKHTMLFAPENPDAPISRTYLNGSGSTQQGGTSNKNWRQGRRQKPEQVSGQKTTGDVVISFQDFQNHLAVGQNRISRMVTLTGGGTISMNVGAEGLATGEVWTLPDLSPAAYPLPQGRTLNFNSLAVTSTPNYEFFTSEDVETGVVTNPAAAYDLDGEFIQYLDFFVSEFEGETFGTLDNLGYDRDGEIIGIYATATPIPLSLETLDLEVEVIGIPCDLLSDGCGSGTANAETFDLQQDFTVVASGTLNTYDGESSEGIKLRNTDIVTTRDNNGNVVSTQTYRYLLWYTKDGHFVKATLATSAPWTGTTSIIDIEYQKLVSAVLPVEWLAVNAEVVKNSEVKVNWSTATESQNERFVVERSTDGQRFFSIAGLAAAGDSQTRQDYTHTDVAPVEGFNYYRIQQQDFDGLDTYSDVVSALITRTAGDEELVVLYPNPGRNEVFFSRPADYELLTIDGKVLAQGRAEQQLNVADLPAGTYLVRIDGGKTHRWVKR
jgi:hypothetical protein